MRISTVRRRWARAAVVAMSVAASSFTQSAVARADASDEELVRRMARVRQISRQILVTRAQERRRQQEELQPVLEALSGLRTTLEELSSTLGGRASLSGFRIHGVAQGPPSKTAREAASSEELEERRQFVRNALHVLSSRRQALTASRSRAEVAPDPPRQAGATESALSSLPEGMGRPMIMLDALERLEAEAATIVESNPRSVQEEADRATRLTALMREMEIKPLALPRHRVTFTPTFVYRNRAYGQ